MEIKHVQLFEDLCDEMNDLFYALDEEGRFKAIKEKLDALTPHLQKDTSFAFCLEMRLIDNNNEKPNIPYHEMGITTASEGKPYNVNYSATLATYIVGGEPIKIPHDKCPKCWHLWDFKFINPACKHCGATLGKDVKILLDEGKCPNCEEGKVGPNKPMCDKCGQEIFPDTVIWG